MKNLADINKTEEIGHEVNCDLDHKIYGQRIKEINKKHEFYRNMFGMVFNLIFFNNSIFRSSSTSITYYANDYNRSLAFGF